MLKRDEAYDHLKSLTDENLLRFMSHVVEFRRSPKPIHGSVMTYTYDSCETFNEKCQSFDPDKFEHNVGDVRWIKIILDLICNNPVDFIIEKAEYICVTLHGIEIVQFRNTSATEKTHYVVIEYDCLQDKIKKDTKTGKLLTWGSLSYVNILTAGLVVGVLGYTYLKA